MATKQTTTHKASKVFSEEEKDAMKSRAQEEKAARAGADGEAELLAKIAEMTPSDRALAERIHALIRASAPELTPKTWYGMPAYAMGNDLICHFQPAQKFKTRYATLGFSDKAKVDDGDMWPVAYALPKLTAAGEATIKALVRKAIG